MINNRKKNVFTESGKYLVGINSQKGSDTGKSQERGFCDLMKKQKKIICTAVVLCTCLLFGSGCGKKKTEDAETSQVIQISIAPEQSEAVTPTPQQTNSAAVVTNGNLTMVNEYLAQQN